MKRILLLISFLLLGAAALQAQEVQEVQETLPAPLDSTLLGRSILGVIGPGVEISQDEAVRQALENYVKYNSSKPLAGYRIRIYHDNGPQARGRSAAIEKAVSEQYQIAVYRTFESPNYKVTVGDFRTKDEALRIYNALKKSYPTAYIIKQTINYPR